MFFDRLFTLTSLKARLLGTSSFAQLYSNERLPLRKFRKEGAMLSPLIAGLLAACGGGGGGGVLVAGGGGGPRPTEDTDTGTTTFDAVGSQIKGATFYFDLDGDGVLDDEEKTEANRMGTSGDDGRVVVSNERLREEFGDDTQLGILADLEGAQNLDTGEIYGEGTYLHRVITLEAIGTMKVLSSITTIYEKLVEGGDTPEAALEKIFGDDVKITLEDLDNEDLYSPIAADQKAPKGSRAEKQQAVSTVAKVLTNLIDDKDVGIDATVDGIDDGTIKIVPKATEGSSIVTISDTAPPALVTAVNKVAEDTAAAIKRERDTELGVPVAVDDAKTLTEGIGAADATNHVSVTGDVLANDINEIGDTGETVISIVHTSSTAPAVGTADAVVTTTDTAGTVGTALVGTYGTLTINADGSYTYVANTDAADKLVDGQTAIDVFTYTSEDDDGTDSATLTFTIEGKNDLPADIKMTGNRAEGFEDTQVGEVGDPDYKPGADTPTDGEGRFILNNGKIVGRDGTEYGILSATDVETLDAEITFSLSGEDSQFFKIVNIETDSNNPPKWQVQRKTDAELAVDSLTPKAAGEKYVFRGKSGYDMRENPPLLLRDDGTLIYISAIPIPPITPTEERTSTTGTDIGEPIIGAKIGDDIDGGGGRDTIDGGGGNDILKGGEGADIFKFTGKKFGMDVIKDFENIDEIHFSRFEGKEIEASFVVKGNAHLDLVLRFVKSGTTLRPADETSVTLENLNGVDLRSLQIFDRPNKAVTLDVSNFRTGNDDLKATGNLPVSLYGGAGNDTLTAANGPSYLFGGDGNDQLIGGSARDVLYGDNGHDSLTGNGGADVFVIQEPTDKEFMAVKSRSSKLTKFLNEATDFEVGVDKIGIPIFSKITVLAEKNNHDFDTARTLYLKDVKARAEKASKGEVEIVLDDLGYYFRLLNPGVFKRDEDGRQQFWSLVDARGSSVTSNQTALMMFHSQPFSSDENTEAHPFGLTADVVFEFV